MKEEQNARFFNSFAYLLIVVMLGAILFTIVGLIYVPGDALLTGVTIVADLMLLLVAFPLAVIQYLKCRDETLQVVLIGVTLTIIVYVVSGIVWLVGLCLPFVSWLSTLSGVLLLIGYAPVIGAFGWLLRRHGLPGEGRRGFGLFVVLINAAGIAMVLLFTLLRYRQVETDDLTLWGNALFTIFDMATMTLSGLLTLRFLPTRYRYYFVVLFAGTLLSFAGDSLSLLSCLGLFDAGSCARLFYDVMLIMCTTAFVVLTLADLKMTTVEEVDRKLSDMRLQMKDLVTQSPDAMGIFEPGGSLILANAPFAEIFGTAWSGRAQPNLFDDLLPAGDGTAGQIGRVRAGHMLSIDELAVSPSADPDMARYVSLKVFPTYASDGAISSFIAIAGDVTVRRRAEDALKRAYQEMGDRVRESLNEKEIMLKEIHHRVKNNLQIISSMLNLQSSRMDDPSVRYLNTESQSRIRSMALIHEKLYQSGSMSRIDFGAYVRHLAQFIINSYCKDTEVRVDVDIRNVELNVNFAVPCGLIMNELLTNSMKYAFAGRARGRVSVVMTADPDRYVLTVSDDGVGLPGPVDLERADTLGLSLVYALVGQLDGAVEVSTGSGTCFRMIFPAGKTAAGQALMS